MFYFYVNTLIMKSKLVLSFITCLVLTNTFGQRPKAVRKGMLPQTQTTPKNNQAYYTVMQFNGKWQEIKRTPFGKKEHIGFTDTLLMKFDSNKVEMKDATSMRMSMKGEVTIEPPYILIAAGDEYVIKYLDTAKMILDDGESIREFVKKEKYYHESLGKLIVPTEVLETPVNLDPKNMTGKWLVYRRQAAAGSVESDAVVIKSLEIFPSETIGSAKGVVVCYKDNTESFPCQIVFGNANILVITDKYAWEFNTYKANGNEFVFGEAGRMLYYAKIVNN